MTVQDLIQRATATCALPITYSLGAGGMHPASATPADRNGRCDCSGFVSWCLGMSRVTDILHYVRFNNGWINTDAMVADIRGPQTLFRWCDPQPGAVVVFPGPPLRSVGHCGIIVATSPLRVVHCSSGNWRHTQHAVQITGYDVFARAQTTHGWFVGLEREQRQPAVVLQLPHVAPSIHTTMPQLGTLPTLDPRAAIESDTYITSRPAPVGWFARLRARLARGTTNV